MARPIKNTPILYGKDAREFLDKVDRMPSQMEREREREHIRKSVERLKQNVAKLK